jgi:hypothetical protein
MPTGPVIMIVVLMFFPMFLILYNRKRVKGKVLGFILRKDKSVLPKLCELRDAFIIFEHRAYDVYPDLIRVSRFPAGWPAMFQEVVPAGLWDEENAIQLDWITLQPFKEGSMSLRAALDENWIRKFVEETARENGVGKKFNWRKVLPILIIGLGVIGIIVIFSLKGGGGCAIPKIGG